MTPVSSVEQETRADAEEEDAAVGSFQRLMGRAAAGGGGRDTYRGHTAEQAGAPTKAKKSVRFSTCISWLNARHRRSTGLT